MSHFKYTTNWTYQYILSHDHPDITLGKSQHDNNTLVCIFMCHAPNLSSGIPAWFSLDKPCNIPITYKYSHPRNIYTILRNLDINLEWKNSKHHLFLSSHFQEFYRDLQVEMSPSCCRDLQVQLSPSSCCLSTLPTSVVDHALASLAVGSGDIGQRLGEGEGVALERLLIEHRSPSHPLSCLCCLVHSKQCH